MLLVQTYIHREVRFQNPYWVYENRVWLKNKRLIKISVSTIGDFMEYIKVGDRIAIARNTSN
ncbi:hypothetical protein [Vibrio phage PhiImVa-1]|nr:hypothetical protein [Vibrio phage PhiImVa-1]